jgi:hypothetical protein
MTDRRDCPNRQVNPILYIVQTIRMTLVEKVYEKEENRMKRDDISPSFATILEC